MPPGRVLFLVVAFVALLVVTGLLGGVVLALASGEGDAVWTVISDLVRAAAAFGLYVGLVRLVERRPVVELAARSAGPGLLVHIAWNFTQGGIFGVTISGSALGQDGLFRSTLTGPTLISGGSFGAEASLPAVLLCLAVGVAFLIVAHRTGRVRPPVWRRRSSVNDGR